MRLVEIEPFGISALEIAQAARQNQRKGIGAKWDEMSPVDAMQAAELTASKMRFRFDRPHRSQWPHHRPQRWDKVQARGWANCADAAALALAVGIRRGLAVSLVLSTLDDCMHATVAYSGRTFDPFARHGCGPLAARLSIPWDDLNV